MPADFTFLLPELRALSAGERAGAWRRALAEPFDTPELVALAVALLGSTTSLAAGALVAALVLLRRSRRGMAGHGA